MKTNDTLNKSDFLEYVFRSLDDKKYNYVVLHSYEGLPLSITSDIDMAIEVNKIDDVRDILERITKITNWRIVQMWKHEDQAIDFVLSNNKEFIQLDFCLNYQRNNRTLISNGELLKNKIKYKNFYIPNKNIEFTYILLKKVLKRDFSLASKIRLHSLMKNLSEVEIKNKLNKYFSSQNTNNLLELITHNDFEKIENNIMLFYNDLLKKTFTIQSVGSYIFFDIKRKINRIIRPTGLFIVILGVDGAGKTTITKEILEKYDAFRGHKHFHCRIGFLNNLGRLTAFTSKNTDYTNPHKILKQKKRVSSFLRFLYYFMDYIITSLFVFYSKRRSRLIVIERYYLDYYFDKIRYKINLPDQVLDFFYNFVAKPDKIFVLTGDSQVLYDRKAEITLNEIEKQKEAYNKKFEKETKVEFIDTVQNDVKQSVEMIIESCNNVMRNEILKKEY